MEGIIETGLDAVLVINGELKVYRSNAGSISLRNDVSYELIRESGEKLSLASIAEGVETEECISPASMRVVLTSPYGNPLPIFFYLTNSIFVVSRRIKYIRLIISDLGIEEKVSNVGALSAVIFDGPIGEYTYFDNLYKAPMASVLDVDIKRGQYLKRDTWFPSFDDDQYRNTSRNDIVELAKDVILGLKDGLPKGGVLLPLTGGLDSRLLACLAASASDSDVHSYTFERGPSFETYCARKVASALGIKHAKAKLTLDCYDLFSDDVVIESGGMLSAAHVHGVYSAKKLIPADWRAYPRVFGYNGDPMTGGQSYSHNGEKMINSPRSLFDHYICGSIFKGNQDSVYELLKPTIEQIFNDFSQKISNSDYFLEYWIYTQRQNALTTHIFDYHRSGAEVYLPYLDERFCRFFTSIPHEYRLKRNLLIEASQELWPNVFSIPSTQLDTKSKIAHAAQLLKSIEDKSNKIFGKYNVIRSPFEYEHQSDMIENELNKKVNDSLSFAAKEIFPSFEFATNISRPLWKTSNAPECFRLISLNTLFSH